MTTTTTSGRFSGEPLLHDLGLYPMSAGFNGGDSVVSTSLQLLHHIGNRLRRGLAALTGQMAVGLARQPLSTEIDSMDRVVAGPGVSSVGLPFRLRPASQLRNRLRNWLRN